MGEKIVAIVANQLLVHDLLRSLKVPIDDFMGNWIGHFAHGVARNIISEETAIEAAYRFGNLIDYEGLSTILIESSTHEKSYAVYLNNNDMNIGIKNTKMNGLLNKPEFLGKQLIIK